jgi:hypothetical protein
MDRIRTVSFDNSSSKSNCKPGGVWNLYISPAYQRVTGRDSERLGLDLLDPDE